MSELDTTDWPSFADGPYLVASADAVKAVAQRRRAKGEHNFADPLLEQVAELLDLRDEDRRRAEGEEEIAAGLRAVIAVAGAWLEAIERREPSG